MKLKILLLTLSSLSILFCGNAYSKTKLTTEKLTDIEIIKSEKKTDEREDLGAVDFNKLFSEAQNYYKLAKEWKILKCSPKSGFICSKHECKRRDIFSNIILDKNKKTVSRCEKDICETFEAEFEQTGSFINVQSKGAIGSIIRILGDSRYKEITTVGLDAYIANGNCELVKNN